jgi:2-methylisocitrate lyase-like PEP mutase family enzyme
MPAKRLNAIIAARNATIVPGAPSALFARVIERTRLRDGLHFRCGHRQRAPGAPQVAFKGWGSALVLYANAALHASLKAMNDVLGALKREGPCATGWLRSRSVSASSKKKYDRFEAFYTNGLTAADK